MPPNYCVAAQRSYRDADLLEQQQRLANADHLYGLAAECALKAVLVGLGVIPPAQDPPRVWRKHIDQLWNEYFTYTSGPGLGRYLVAADCPFHGWRVDHRYEDEALFTAERVSQHARGARTVVALLQQAMLDGVVT